MWPARELVSIEEEPGSEVQEIEKIGCSDPELIGVVIGCGLVL